MNRAIVSLVLVAACGAVDRPVRLVEEWPTAPTGAYAEVTGHWTRTGRMRGPYQEAIEVAATFKSPEWRAARAQKDADARGLEGEARAQRIAQARADAAGPYELELMVVTWDRRENDLDRGAKSVWRVRLLDEHGMEIEPLEIVKDKRPPFIIREEFPAFGDFATAYVARFPRTHPLLGPDVRRLHLRFSSTRGGISLIWRAP
ncbi:MAG TPA: hypothetical protein VN253_28875 [Kofleriaceae bacterium]|nr:hypothetical protein [Kofleriaceae bacterium]